MHWLLLATALAAAPPIDAHRIRCDLGPIPDAEIALSTTGELWILDKGDVIVEQDLGMEIPPQVSARCNGTKVRLMADLETRATLGFQTITMDFADVIANLDADRIDPRRLETTTALRELEKGEVDPLDSFQALRDAPVEWADPAQVKANTATAIWKHASTLNPVDAFQYAQDGLDQIGGLPAVNTYFSVEQRDAILTDIGHWLILSARYEEALAVYGDLAGPAPTQVLLESGDAYWALGRKKEAKTAYLNFANSGPGEVPSRVLERCKKCLP